MKAKREREPSAQGQVPKVDERQIPLVHVGKMPVPVDVVLGRLDEILQEPNHNATCRIYCAEGGLMIEWRSRARILYSEVFKNLMKVAELVGGELYVMPSDDDVKANSGNSYRVMDVTIRSGPVMVYPLEAKAP